MSFGIARLQRRFFNKTLRLPRGSSLSWRYVLLGTYAWPSSARPPSFSRFHAADA